MISIDIDGMKAIKDRLDVMVETIDHLQHVDIADELSAWQTEDMHRHRPFTKHRRAGARTTIRPHSWYEVKGRRRLARRLMRRGRYIARWSTRPILRPQLLDRLYERMAELLRDKLRW